MTAWQGVAAVQRDYFARHRRGRGGNRPRHRGGQELQTLRFSDVRRRFRRLVRISRAKRATFLRSSAVAEREGFVAWDLAYLRSLHAGNWNMEAAQRRDRIEAAMARELGAGH